MEAETYFALNAIRRAAGFTQMLQRTKPPQSIIKKDNSPVTLADIGSQILVAHYLLNTFPDDLLVAEENILELNQKNPRLLEVLSGEFSGCIEGFSIQNILDKEEVNRGMLPGDRYWVLDPVDGTKGFLRGEQFAIALALIENNVPVFGVLACPNLNLRMDPEYTEPGILAYATRGQGAWIQGIEQADNQTRLSVSNCSDVTAARFVSSVESTGHSNNAAILAVKAHYQNREEIQQVDSQVKYIMVAAGRCDLFLRLPPANTPTYHEKVWDHAAGALIVQEAGGMVTDLSGDPFDFSTGRELKRNSGVIVSNSTLHPAIVDYFLHQN